MGKMMSILEKYKLVEKDDESSTHVESSTPATQDTIPPVAPKKEVIEKEAIKKEIVEDSPKNITEAPKQEPPSIPKHTSSTENSTPSYDVSISIDEIYAKFGLGDVGPTESVFLLENLIQALPAELPEFVKKTTIDNIAKASAMDVDKLLKDGESRSANLKNFINDFTTSNQQNIASLKAEIDKLNALIADYHQRIKYKEMLIHEETTLVENEMGRIHNILEFFKG